MKINLLLNNPAGALSGYINIDAIHECEPDLEKGLFHSDVTPLDKLVDDGEAEQIVATEILEYFPAKDVDGILDGWLKKLKHGGTIIVTDIDALEVNRSLLNRRISMEDVNLLLYGHQQHPWQYRKCCLTITQICDALRNKGMKIVGKKVADYKFVVEARRP
jgi:hypothetical protein